MDIKNILNDADRNAPDNPPCPSLLAPAPGAPSLYAYSQVSPQPQQIVYTGPVFQLPPSLPPPVDMHHLANALHYRYAPPIDYVYQDYPEHQPQAFPGRYNPTGHSVPSQPSLHIPPAPYCRSRLLSMEPTYDYRSPIRLTAPPDTQEPSHPSVDRHPPCYTPPSLYKHPCTDYSFSHYVQYPAAPKRPRPERHSRVEQPHPYSPSPSYQAPSSYPERNRRRFSRLRERNLERERERVGYITSQDSSERARKPLEDAAEEHAISTDNNHTNLPSTKHEPQLCHVTAKSSKPARKRKRRDRMKKSEFESRHSVARRSHNAATVLAHRFCRRDLPPNSLSASDSDHWHSSTSEDNMARNHNNPLATSISEKGNPRSLTKRRHKPVKRTKHKPAARLGKSNSFRLSNSSAEAHIALNPPPQRVEQAQVHVPIDEHSEDEEILDGEDEFGERMISESTSSSFQCVLRRKDDEDSGESSLKDVSSLRGSHCNSNSHIDSPIPENGKLATLHADPDEEYPPVCTDFLGVPPSAIGDMLQVWEFVTAFSKTLRLTPFKLIHLQQAVVHSERSSLVDSCIVRLVQTIISDKGLVEELGISESVVKALTEMDPKRVVGSTLDGLPNILSFESDEVDDHLLHATVKKLATVSSRWAFYKTIDPGARFRVLRELVDYATMTDALRKCVSDSMEHTEEEKKKAREEHSANRKRLQLQIRELRTELADYKVKNGLVDNGSQTEAGKVDANGNGKESGRKSESASMSTEREEAMTRQEKLRVLQRERREREDRKSKERGAELIISKIEKIRGSLKALKTVRQRGRGKEGSNGEIMRPYSNMAPSVQREDPVRTYAIGSDREDRCYWFFQGSGRIWIENTRNGDWYTLTNSESIQGLLKWLSPYRKEEELLKENILHHLELIESEMEQEAKDILQVELEMQEVMRLDAQRTTRARKRKASMEAQLKTKKCGSIPTFLDYHNAEI